MENDDRNGGGENGRGVVEPTYKLSADGTHNLVTVCMYCEKVKTVDDEWVTGYVLKPSEEESHGICNPCTQEHYPDLGDGIEKAKQRREAGI